MIIPQKELRIKLIISLVEISYKDKQNKDDNIHTSEAHEKTCLKHGFSGNNYGIATLF